MGVICDIFIADEASVLALGDDDIPVQKFPGVERCDVDVVKLATLCSILGVLTIDEAVDLQVFVRTFSEDDGPWVTFIPDQLRDALAALDAEATTSIGLRRADTDEFRLDDWTADDVSRVLVDLVRLSKEASTSGRSLYEWISL